MSYDEALHFKSIIDKNKRDYIVWPGDEQYEKDHNNLRPVDLNRKVSKLIDIPNRFLNRINFNYSIYWNRLDDNQHRNVISLDPQNRSVKRKLDDEEENDYVTPNFKRFCDSRSQQLEKNAVKDVGTKIIKNVPESPSLGRQIHSQDFINPYSLRSIKKASEKLKKYFFPDPDLENEDTQINETHEMLKMKMGLESAFDEDAPMIEKRLDFTYYLRQNQELRRKAFENIGNPSKMPPNYKPCSEIMSNNSSTYTQKIYPTYKICRYFESIPADIRTNEDEYEDDESSSESFCFFDDEIQIIDYKPGDATSKETRKNRLSSKDDNSEIPLIVID